jgi:hypothetical protein
MIEARAEISVGGKLDPTKLDPIAAKYPIRYNEPS